MSLSIMRFLNESGEFEESGVRQTVPALFLVSANEGEREWQQKDVNVQQYPKACFITPRIQEMYSRFLEKGVQIISKLPEERELGLNFTFSDPDGNISELWQP